MKQLSKLRIRGFRSIDDATIDFTMLNVLIGANGAGKSNLIDFFRMLNYALSRGFQTSYLADRGPASHILHFGPRHTPLIDGELEFLSDSGKNFYRFSLAYVKQDDSFIFTNEEVQFHRFGADRPTKPIPLGPGGHRESGLAELWADEDPTARFIKSLIAGCRVFQFHDTSISSFMRSKPFVDDSRYLRADGGNLASILLRLRTEEKALYRDVVRTLQLILPWFEDFILEPEGPLGKQVLPLRWKMPERVDYDFVAGQLSDGSLRAIALVTLLTLPERLRPAILIIDEPELGLHPVAEEIIAGLIRAASRTSQIILSTQSATFIDRFTVDDVVVVENEKGNSSFRRLSSDGLQGWLQRYTLSQIWSKNLIGGRP